MSRVVEGTRQRKNLSSETRDVSKYRHFCVCSCLMASSSRVSCTKYDVFISFRGTDVRSDFLSHLKKELLQKKIDVYIDDRLDRGDEVSQALPKAIEQSLFSLIIFSKDYASSKWCLKELLKIMECKDTHGQIVFPIFYHIEPTHVRHQTGSYGKAFAEHDKNCKEEVQSWRSALTNAANLSGFHASNYKDEAELVEQVAKSLSKRLNTMYPGDIRKLVGLDKKVAELESLLMLGSEDVRLIGIWGMGGIGKTTIATVLYHRFCYDFEGYCFQANVREESQKHGIIHLKKKIYEMLLNEKDIDICTPIGLPLHIERKLGRMKILLVLDDINDSDQLESLVGEPDFLGPGSRIIITTRDKEVLSEKVSKIYEVKPLMADDALELFHLNAFKENRLDVEWVELSKRVIKYAKKLPLALKVLGSFLRGKSKEDWKSQMEKLERMPFKKIHDVLRLSYDSLDRKQKTIFLYIACCFKGYKRCDIIALLDACGFSTTIELAVLRDKALITWSSKLSIISMHDLIEEMGKEIVREESIEDPGKRSLLWDPDDIHKVLQYNMGTATIQSIISNKIGADQELSLNPQVFARMHNLKFLKLLFDDEFRYTANVELLEGLEYLPNELRLLYWHNYPLKSLPSTFCPKYLVQLHMTNSYMEKLWDGVMSLGKLKKIDLSRSYYLVELPDLSMAQNLEELVLSGCISLRVVHPYILSLPKLEKLILSRCSMLTSLGSNIHSKSLSQLSVTSGNVINLSLAETTFKKLPSSIGYLRKLEYLNLGECELLTVLPNNLVELTSLHYLSIAGCKKLVSLPQLPPSIEQLKANDCRSLESILFTSEAGDPLNKHLVGIRLEDCMKLDEHSRKNVELITHLNLRNYAFKSPEEQCKSETPMDYIIEPRVLYPGDEVPEWFKHRTSKGRLITFAPRSKLLGFIFCIILQINEMLEVRCFLENNDDEKMHHPKHKFVFSCQHGIPEVVEFDSKNVCMFYASGSGINSRIEEMKGIYENDPKLSFEFSTPIYDQNMAGLERKYWKWNTRKKCGVYPIYAEPEDFEEDEKFEEDEDSEEDEELQKLDASALFYLELKHRLSL